MTHTKPLQTLRRTVEPGLAQQYVGEQTAAHADLPMNAPHRQRDTFLIQRRFPREHMLVHAVDERTVEIEKKGCFIAHRVSPYCTGSGRRAIRTADRCRRRTASR